MLKIIIADDEELIRKRLITRIDWESYGFSHIYEATNGEEVIELIKENAPELLITDIRMPVKDGIELVKEIRKENYDIEIIVISGFADFQYAQNMMKYGVGDYILKPIKKELLIEAVLKINNKIFEKNVRQKEAKAKYLIDAYNGSQLSEDVVYEKCQYLICKVIIETGNELILYEEIKTIVKTRFDDFFKVVCIDEKSNKFTLFLEIYNQNIEESLKNIFVNLNENNYGYTCSIYYTEVCNNTLEINRLKTDVEKIDKIRPFLGPKKLVSINDIVLNEEDDFETIMSWVDRIIKCLNKEEKEPLEKTVVELFDEFLQFSLSYEFIIKTCFQIVNLIYKYMYENGKVNVDIKLIYKKVFSDLDKIEFFDDLRCFIYELLNNHARVISNTEKDSIKYYVEKAISYIEDNYSKEISLNNLSSHIGLSDTYLSHIFKEYTGINYTEYLRNKRVEKACELLKTSDLKVYEVAVSVGINNSRYFGDVFKEKIGITPNEYKTRYRGDSNEK